MAIKDNEGMWLTVIVLALGIGFVVYRLIVGD